MIEIYYLQGVEQQFEKHLNIKVNGDYVVLLDT